MDRYQQNSDTFSNPLDDDFLDGYGSYDGEWGAADCFAVPSSYGTAPGMMMMMMEERYTVLVSISPFPCLLVCCRALG